MLFLSAWKALATVGSENYRFFPLVKFPLIRKYNRLCKHCCFFMLSISLCDCFEIPWSWSCYLRRCLYQMEDQAQTKEVTAGFLMTFYYL